jgi:membrane-associated phospholipid phosphatase
MRHTKTDARSLVTLALVGLIGPLFMFALLGDQVEDRRASGWDHAILDLITYFPRTPGDRAIGLATYAAVLAAALVPLVLLWKRRRREALFWALLIGGVLALDPLLKNSFRRPSVGGGNGYSFPSGSAMLSVAVAAAIVLLARRGKLLLALAGAIIVIVYGISIVRAEWHYPTDVLAGWALSFAWVTALWLVFAAPSFNRLRKTAALRRRDEE